MGIGEDNFSENNVEVGKMNFRIERGRITEENSSNTGGRRTESRVKVDRCLVMWTNEKKMQGEWKYESSQ